MSGRAEAGWDVGENTDYEGGHVGVWEVGKKCASLVRWFGVLWIQLETGKLDRA